MCHMRFGSGSVLSHSALRGLLSNRSMGYSQNGARWNAKTMTAQDRLVPSRTGLTPRTEPVAHLVLVAFLFNQG